MLHGELQDFRLDEVLGFLEVTGKTGCLTVERDDARGRISVRAGGVLDATADASRLQLARRLIGRGLLDAARVRGLVGDATVLPRDLDLAASMLAEDHLELDVLAPVVHEQAIDACFELLEWSEGSFHFDAGEELPGVADLATLPVAEVLAAARERAEQWPHIEAATGAPETTVTITAPRRGAEVDLDADAWQLIGLIDGARTVADLVRLTGRGHFDVRRDLLALHEAGIVGLGNGDGRAALDRLVRAQTVLEELEGRLDARMPVRAPAKSDAQAADGRGVDAQATDGQGADSQAAGGQAAAASGSAPSEPAAARAPGGPAPGTPKAPTLDADPEPVSGRQAAGDTGDEHGAARDQDARDQDGHDPDAPAMAAAIDDPDGGRARPKLRTDPSIDTDIVDRLIAGIRTLS